MLCDVYLSKLQKCLDNEKEIINLIILDLFWDRCVAVDAFGFHGFLAQPLALASCWRTPTEVINRPDLRPPILMFPLHNSDARAQPHFAHVELLDRHGIRHSS